MTKINKIKSLEDFKEYNIICTTTEEVKECLLLLNKTDKQIKNIRSIERIVFYSLWSGCYLSSMVASFENKNISFYRFKKIYKKLKKQKKQEIPDFEVDENGRIININNYQSKKIVYYFDTEKGTLINKNRICHFYESVLNLFISCGYVFDNKEALDNYIKYLTIHTKIKNLAEKLNKGQKIDWSDKEQYKYYLCYNYINEQLSLGFNRYFKDTIIYCLDNNFKKEAIKEIGEEDLKWYLKQSF